MTEKYATVGHDFDGMNFRTIARKMTKSGFRMNHATARNILHTALNKITTKIVADGCLEGKDPFVLARSASFQSALGAIVQDLYSGRQ